MIYNYSLQHRLCTIGQKVNERGKLSKAANESITETQKHSSIRLQHRRWASLVDIDKVQPRVPAVMVTNLKTAAEKTIGFAIFTAHIANYHGDQRTHARLTVLTATRLSHTMSTHMNALQMRSPQYRCTVQMICLHLCH